VFDAHPEVAGVFESWMFHDRLGFAGLFDRVFWDPEVTAGNVRKIGRPLGLGALIDRATLCDDLRVLASSWLGNAMGPGHRFLVEKTPVHLHFAPVIAQVFPDARFVEVVRDGRDAAVSTISASRSWNPRIAGRTGTSVKDVARDWNITVAAGNRHARTMADRWCRVRFEELRANFAGTVSRVLSFCEIPYDDAMIERLAEATDITRHATGEGSFRRTGHVGDWRARFSVLDAWQFDRAAGASLVSLGYERDRSWWRTAARPRRLRRAA
jgi:hypothetical protein